MRAAECAPKCLFQPTGRLVLPLSSLLYRVYSLQASAARPAKPTRAANATFQAPAPSETAAPLSGFESTAELPLDELLDELLASLSVVGTCPSAKLDPQDDEMAPKTDDSVDDDVPFDKAEPSLVTSPCAQSVQTDDDGID